MKKIVVVVVLLTLLSLTGCSKDRSMQACVTGCVAGMNYNGTAYEQIELNEPTIARIHECQRFCKVYFESPGANQDLLPEGLQ